MKPTHAWKDRPNVERPRVSGDHQPGVPTDPNQVGDRCWRGHFRGAHRRLDDVMRKFLLPGAPQHQRPEPEVAGDRCGNRSESVRRPLLVRPRRPGIDQHVPVRLEAAGDLLDRRGMRDSDWVKGLVTEL